MNIATLGLVLKSGNMVFGFDAVKEELQKPNTAAAGILLSCELSAKTKKEVEFLRDKFHPDIEILQTEWDMDRIGKTIGKKTGIIAVTDTGFWKSITKRQSGDKASKAIHQ